MNDREKLLDAEREIDGGFPPENEPKISSKTNKKEGDKDIHVSFFEVEGYIYEQMSATDATDATSNREGGAAFIRYSKENDTWDIVNEFEFKGKRYLPIVDEAYLKGGIILPTGVTEYKNTAEIINQIKDFLHENIELPTFYEAFVPNLILFYWVYEKFPFIPYLQFVGRTATGKSTAMEVVGSISYKPIDTTGSLTIASMFRMATLWKGTLLIDEFEQVGENSREIVSFLKSGVSDRLVLRTEGDVKKDVKAYIVKAPKIFTSENPINDAGLQSRTLVVKMEKSKRKLPLFRLQHYYKEAEAIRNKLLLWRLRNFNKINLKDIEFGFEELKSFDRRVQQVITPIYYFSDNETKKEILTFAVQQEEETKRERREGLDGKIFEFIYEHKEEDVTIAMIFDYLNAGNKMRVITERKIGGIIRSILGFDIDRVGHENIRTIVLENMEEKLDDLANYYGLNSNNLYKSSSIYRVAQDATVADNVPCSDKDIEDIFGNKTST